MARNDKTPVTAGVCHCVAPCLVCVCGCQSNTIAPARQPPRSTPPRPGTALVYFLRRYRVELDEWQEGNGGRATQSLIDCCSALINEGVRHG